jgi:probable selenium-dependent hydroxylase accessory protein YqeC
LFSEQFAFEKSALVNFVGGGGKTALIHRLLLECSPPRPAIYTTTTRIHPPHPCDGFAILTSDDTTYLKMIAESIACQSFERVWRLVITGSILSPGLLRGVPPDFASRLDRGLFSIILNEADGARSMSIKVPHEAEPVLMEGARYLVPVIGIDCLQKPLGPDVVFRWEIAEKRLSLAAGQPLTTKLAAFLLMNPAGVCKSWRPEMRIVPYINKVDDDAQDRLAESLARAILRNEYFPVERVVWGSLLTGRVASMNA